MNSEIQQKFQNYLDLHKSLSKMRKEQKETKTLIDKLEKEIKEYMTENDMDSISLKDGEIILYSKKVSQTFKKEAIMEKINEHLKDLQESETITESILHNKKFILQDKIKAVIKKK
jgi:DNA repair ATPase RecN